MKLSNKLILVALTLVTAISCREYPNYIEDSDYEIESDPSLFAVYPVASSVPAEGGEIELKVTGNEEWTATLVESNSKAPNWCVLDNTAGTGSGTIKISISSSTSFVKNRTVVVQLTNGTKTLRSKIIQATLTLGEDEVLINGLIWSTKNVGQPGTFTDSIDEVGMLYQFNRKTGYPFANKVPEFAEAYTSYTPSESGYIVNAWTEDNNPCPEGWRVPTGQEVCDLLGDSQNSLKATWVEPSDANGFSRPGFIAGIDPVSAASATKETVKSLGGIFIPQSGWLTEGGVLDRNWLVTLRTATSLNDNMGGMFLSGYGYTDAWGWGDGHKKRATMVRCVKKVNIED